MSITIETESHQSYLFKQRYGRGVLYSSYSHKNGVYCRHISKKENEVPMPSSQGPTYSQPKTPPEAPIVAAANPVEQQQRSSLFTGWTLLPMRLFLGVTFVYAGMQKLTDPQFFHKSTPGYIGNQIIGFAHGSPLHDILITQVLSHAMLFGYAIAFGEIAIGLGALFGLLFRPAAFFGIILSLIFFLTASWHVYPYFYGADIVFAFCWLIMLLHGPTATGYPSLDSWLMTTLFPQKTSKLISFVRALLIGVPDMSRVTAVPDEVYHAVDTHSSSRQGNAQQRVRAITQRKREARRSFLQGAITGMSAIVGIGIVGFVVNSLFSNNANNAGPTTPNAPPTALPNQNGNTSTSSGTGSNTVIAQVSAVAKNDAATFTIPSTGDPGVLIHLANNQFVAYDATCTHAGCQVDYDPGSQHLICPCHGATYDPAQQAAVLSGPTNTPLTQVAIHVDSATGAITLQ
jgi:thiosulfate dehydrogenase (quinone) large subunit